MLPRNGNTEAGFSRQVHALKSVHLNQFTQTDNFPIFFEQRFIRCHLSNFGLTPLPIHDCRYVQLSFASRPMNSYLHGSEFSPCALLLPLRVSSSLFYSWKQRLLPVIHYQIKQQSFRCCCHVAVTASALCKTMRSTINHMRSVKVEANFIDIQIINGDRLTYTHTDRELQTHKHTEDVLINCKIELVNGINVQSNQDLGLT